MATVTLTRADTVIALRNAWADARESAKTFGRVVTAFRFQLLLRAAYDQIRRAKAREAHKAAEAARAACTYVEYDATATRPAGRWYGPEALLDMRDAAELEVLRWEMADSFTAEGNSRLFEAKAQLRAIEAQLTWRTVA
jgi:hypothetical protein